VPRSLHQRTLATALRRGPVAATPVRPCCWESAGRRAAGCLLHCRRACRGDCAGARRNDSPPCAVRRAGSRLRAARLASRINLAAARVLDRSASRSGASRANGAAAPSAITWARRARLDQARRNVTPAAQRSTPAPRPSSARQRLRTDGEGLRKAAGRRCGVCGRRARRVKLRPRAISSRSSSQATWNGRPHARQRTAPSRGRHRATLQHGQRVGRARRVTAEVRGIQADRPCVTRCSAAARLARIPSCNRNCRRNCGDGSWLR